MRRAFEEGFGVGYRKDYQLDNWIAWLGKVNELEPDLASKRISDYAQAIQGLDDSIENRAVHSATADLLGTTFTWSPVRGHATIRLAIGRRAHYLPIWFDNPFKCAVGVFQAAHDRCGAIVIRRITSS